MSPWKNNLICNMANIANLPWSEDHLSDVWEEAYTIAMAKNM